MDITTTLFFSFGYYPTLIFLLFLYMNLWFIISLVLKRNDVVDIAWGLGFIFIAWISFFLSEEPTLLGIIVNVLITIWGVRLSYHIFERHKGTSEDFRYNTWQKTWGKLFYLRSYFQVYILQGVLLFLVITPVLIINNYPGAEVGLFAYIGSILWVIGFFFETVSDYQLKRFTKNPHNEGVVLKSGLWRYSRHPNYFGETVQWWGIGVIALSVPYGWIGFLGPVTITILILFISGIPLLERKLEKRKGFKEYKQKTSLFFPLPPKE